MWVKFFAHALHKAVDVPLVCDTWQRGLINFSDGANVSNLQVSQEAAHSQQGKNHEGHLLISRDNGAAKRV